MRNLFSFPNPVNEKAARVVAAVVMRAGLLPETVCGQCADISGRLGASAGRDAA